MNHDKNSRCVLFFFASFKVLSHLTVKERCLCASLVCKYWRDLCLDFQFWKQIDLSGLQQVSILLSLNVEDRFLLLLMSFICPVVPLSSGK